MRISRIGLYLAISVILALAESMHLGKDYSLLKNDKGHLIEVRSTNGEDSGRRLKTRSECGCMCRRKWGNDGWHCCDCGWSDSGCFPASSTVTLANGDVINMAQLKADDYVMTLSDTGERVTSRVLSLLERIPDSRTLFRQIRTSSGHVLEATSSHLVFVSDTNTSSSFNPVYMSRVTTGQFVRTAEGSTSRVIATSPVLGQGTYNPMTEHGTLLVDGILASCYASFDHEMAHRAMAPIRWFPSLFQLLEPSEGVHPYVGLLKKAARWVLPPGDIYQRGGGVQERKEGQVFDAALLQTNVGPVEKQIIRPTTEL